MNQTGTASAKGYISVDDAKEAAFAHAGVNASDVVYVETDFDSEHGVMVYEVEFYAGNVEYAVSYTHLDVYKRQALNRDRLETTLHSFGVAANIVGVTRGPTVTRYDLELDAGVKLTKLTNLSSDLALSLGVMNVRIAPIPDKISTVGVEVPKMCIRDRHSPVLAF